MAEKSLIINFTPTGLISGRAQSPHVALSPAQVVAEVRKAIDYGITVVHLHARDAREQPSSDPKIYAQMIAGIREFAPELVICVSLSGRRVTDLEERCAPLGLSGQLKPDMASLTLSSLNFAREASLNEPRVIFEIAQRLLDRGIVPELEVFDLGMTQAIHYLIAKRLLVPPYYVNILVGGPFIAQPNLLHLGALLASLPPGAFWSVGGIGRSQLTANTLALALGGGVRVGLEDNLYRDQATQVLATNAELLERIQQLARILERPLMSPLEFRRLLGLEENGKSFGRRPEEQADAE